MTRALSRLRLARDKGGSVVVEFGLLAPLMITMLMGVFQIGISMHAYNSMRGIAADVSRYALTNYQTSSRLSTSQLRDYGVAVASNSPYGLESENVEVVVANATVQRISGATEMTFTINYRMDSLLNLIDLPAYTMSYSRPMFVSSSV